MSTGEDLLDAECESYERHVISSGIAPEVLLFEVARALDATAFSVSMALPDADDVVSRNVRKFRLIGAATALRPLLRVLKGTSRGFPLAPTTGELSDFADAYLRNCGLFAHVRRLLALERYNLARTTITAPGRIRIEVVSDEEDRRDADSMRAVQDLTGDDARLLHAELVPADARLRALLDAYVGIDRGWFIRYDNDDTLIEYYRELAERRARRYFEAEALPSDARVGGQTFASWCDAAAAASGRVLQHIAFCLRLQTRHPQLALRDIMTIYARRDDVRGVLVADGQPREYVDAVLHALTLDDSRATGCMEHHEIPLPLLIDFARDFVLLPCFGALLNPMHAVARHLRTTYRADWDAAVAQRESRFRTSLREVLPEPRFFIPAKGVTIRRPDGSVLTDIDAIVVDRSAGSLTLVQLKWPDVHARSLQERESRRKNLLKANDWVDRVATWVAGRSSAVIAACLNIEGVSSSNVPHIAVVSRYSARFAGNAPYDARATWLAWADIVLASRELPAGDFFKALSHHSATQPATVSQRVAPRSDTFRFSSLTVDVHTA